MKSGRWALKMWVLKSVFQNNLSYKCTGATQTQERFSHSKQLSDWNADKIHYTAPIHERWRNMKSQLPDSAKCLLPAPCKSNPQFQNQSTCKVPQVQQQSRRFYPPTAITDHAEVTFISLCSCQLWLANCSFTEKDKIRRMQENLTEINTVDYATVQNPDSNEHPDEVTGIKRLEMLSCSRVFKRHPTSYRLAAPLVPPLLTFRQRRCLLFCIYNISKTINFHLWLLPR